MSLVQLMGFAENIYNREQRAFRLNIVFGVILQHRETGQYRYFLPYNRSVYICDPGHFLTGYFATRNTFQRATFSIQKSSYHHLDKKKLKKYNIFVFIPNRSKTKTQLARNKKNNF